MATQLALLRSRRAGRRISGLAFCALAILSGGLIGCTSAGQTEHWRMTENVAPSAVKSEGGVNAPASAVRVVFFRAGVESARSKLPANVYIDGQYQASLVGNTYTEQSLCPGSHRLAVQFDDAYRRYSTKAEGVPTMVSDQPIQYFSVSEDAAGNAVLKPAASDALQGVTSLSLRQSHTLPRVVRKGCAVS